MSSHFKVSTCHSFIFSNNSTKNKIILGDKKKIITMIDNAPLKGQVLFKGEIIA
jgi:hypothetical protein